MEIVSLCLKIVFNRNFYLVYIQKFQHLASSDTKKLEKVILKIKFKNNGQALSQTCIYRIYNIGLSLSQNFKFKQMSNNVKGKVLTVQLVQTKTKSDNLHNIKNLNLWGNQLQDLQIIEKMPNLEVISLSVNKISSLKDFAKCTKLQELYLRKNCIVDLRQIKYLLDLSQLKSLWLYDNPCAQHENYRQIVIHHLPNLTKLDNNVLTPQEKQAAVSSKYTLDFSSFSRERQPSVAQSAKKIQQNQSELRKQRPYSELYREDKPQRQSNEPGHRNIIKQGAHHDKENLSRNKNILIAVLSLLKQLDGASLQIVMRQAQTQLKSR